MSSSAAGIAGVGVWTAAAGATAAGDRDDDLGRRGRVNLILELRLGGRAFRSCGRSGWFEDEMLDVQNQLLPGAHLRACITCAYSDYGPVGHGLFGGLACFRDHKAEYRAVRSKADLFRIWGTMTGFVQETYLCPQFERRQPGTGYRG